MRPYKDGDRDWQYPVHRWPTMMCDVNDTLSYCPHMFCQWSQGQSHGGEVAHF